MYRTTNITFMCLCFNRTEGNLNSESYVTYGTVTLGCQRHRDVWAQLLAQNPCLGVFLVLMICSLVGGYQHFRIICCICLEAGRSSYFFHLIPLWKFLCSESPELRSQFVSIRVCSDQPDCVSVSGYVVISQTVCQYQYFKTPSAVLILFRLQLGEFMVLSCHRYN
jgi:hypothetical protein